SRARCSRHPGGPRREPSRHGAGSPKAVRARTHLFVAAETAFGEAVLGLRIAHELSLRGDHVAVLAGERLAVLTPGTPFRSTLVPHGGHQRFDERIAKTATEVRADSIVLLDATLVFWLLK